MLIVDLLPSPIDVGSVTGKDPKDNDLEKNRKPDLNAPLALLHLK